MNFKLISILITIIMVISGCAVDYKDVNIGQKNEAEFLYFRSSDKDLEDFINDFMHRHLRYNEDAVGYQALGSSVMFNKEWEAMALMWFDSTSKTVPDDRHEMMKKWITQIPVDKFGYVWQSMGNLHPTTSSAFFFSQGWLFPNYTDSRTRARGWEFNSSSVEGWETNARQTYTQNGLLMAEYKGERLEYTSPPIKIETFHAPFIELDMRISDNKNFGENSDIEDIYIMWQTENEPEFSEDKMVSHKEFSTIPSRITANFMRHLFFPMHLHEKWEGENIIRLKVVVQAKDGKEIDLNSGINFLRGSYDTRHSNNMTLLLRAAEEYFRYTGDIKFLEENITRLRMATQFMLSHLKGEEGLIDRGYFTGHDGIRGVGHGISNGYFDIVSLPAKDFYGNVYFYKLLKSIEYLEKMVEESKISVEYPEVVSPDGRGVVKYNENSDTLNALAETVKENIRNTFWDPVNKRFYAGYNDNGEKIDYGFLYMNLEAIEAGIPTMEQSKDIMDWVSGKRIIEGDDSTGEDIYAFEFAPRTTTIKNSDHYVWGWGGLTLFGDQVQDGGTVLFLTYYDIMSRLIVYGPEDAFQRLKEVQEWYEKIKDAGGQGERFYRDYYEALGIQLQGGGTAGGIGVDYEFIESAVAYSVIPFGFLGMTSKNLNTITFSPQIPKAIEYLGIENLLFNGVKYDVSAGQTFIDIRAIRGNTENLEFEARFPKPNEKYTIYVNGEKYAGNILEYEDFIYIKIPFEKSRIVVR